jgi:sulfate transport system ATP-binding protein
MKFLGPATELDGQWVRPHDLVLRRQPGDDAHAGVVERITHLGFEVRVDIRMEDWDSTWVQLSRGAAADLGLAPDEVVWISRHGTPTGGSDEPARAEVAHRDNGRVPLA